MISIIICSRTKSISEELHLNIQNTIGVPFEMVIIDNSLQSYSIFEAYNLGIQRANGIFLCFIHDDLLFHTSNWGSEVISIFEKDSRIGLLGVAGAKIKSKNPSAWWDCPLKYRAAYLLQHKNNGTIEKWDYGFGDRTEQEVVVIDGFFMVMKKADNLLFDTNLRGFHNYDLNISFENFKKGLKSRITKNILIEHFSFGNLDSSWYQSSIALHKKYNHLLPISVENISRNLERKIEFNNGVLFLDQLIEFGVNRTLVLMWINLIFIKPISKFHFRFFKKIISKC